MDMNVSHNHNGATGSSRDTKILGNCQLAWSFFQGNHVVHGRNVHIQCFISYNGLYFQPGQSTPPESPNAMSNLMSSLLSSDKPMVKPGRPTDTTDGRKPATDSGDEWYDNVPKEPAKNPDETVVDLDPEQRGNNNARKSSLIRQDAEDPTSPPVAAAQEPSYPLEVVNKPHAYIPDHDRESRL